MVLGESIIFHGEPGAVIDGGDAIRGWDPATEKGAGVYKKAHSAIGYNPSNLTSRNKYIVWAGDQARQTWEWLAWNPSSPQWDGLEALAGNSGAYAYVKFRRGQDPDDEDVTLAPKHRGAFNIDGKGFVVLRGFVLRNAWNAVRVTGGASSERHRRSPGAGGQDRRAGQVTGKDNRRSPTCIGRSAPKSRRRSKNCRRSTAGPSRHT